MTEDRPTSWLSIRTRLFELVRENSIDGVRKILDTGHHPDRRMYDNPTIIQAQAHSMTIEMMKLLLSYGASPHSGYDYDAPLMDMAILGDLEKVSLLLDYGADMEEENEEEKTVLMYAVEEGKEELVELLVDRGCIVPNSVISSMSSRMRSVVMRRGDSLFQKKDRSRTYMPEVFSDMLFF